MSGGQRFEGMDSLGTYGPAPRTRCLSTKYGSRAQTPDFAAGTNEKEDPALRSPPLR